MNIALLTAAGSGSRMQQEIPKQFIHINNKPVILYTLEAFQTSPLIDEIIVVSLENWTDMLWAYARQYDISKLKYIVKVEILVRSLFSAVFVNWRKSTTGQM